MRVDLNVEQGMPLDSYRLEAVLPTIKLLLKNKVRVVLLSHRGRPDVRDKKQAARDKDALSLLPFAPIFAKKLQTPVAFIEVARLGALKKAVEKSVDHLVLVENLRFFKGEDTNDPSFARELAKCGDFYVNDAFAVSHRANASVCAITKYLPSYAGLLMEKELKNLGDIIDYTKHPFTLIIGGAKISDKVGVIQNFWSAGRREADDVLVGGGPANTFLRAEGMNVIDSLVDGAALPLIKPYLNSKKVHLPSDLKWDKTAILDIGPKTVKEYAAVIKRSRVVVWNGPMGWFERKEFGNGTKGIWKAVLANKKAKVIIGGGETVASLQLVNRGITRTERGMTQKRFRDGLRDIRVGRRIWISTGGGAMLDYLSGKKLPGIESLK